MTSKTRAQLAALSLAVGLCLTACAGVASGQVEFPVISGPMVEVQDLQVLEAKPLNVRQAHAADTSRAVTQLAKYLGYRCRLNR
jgi:hypothetical protein